MYLNILKKDLKRKKAMNIIVLVFIILATMFVASSVNNILTVTTALDDYFEMADVPDYVAATMNKSVSPDLDEALENAESIDNYKSEDIIYMTDSNILYKNEPLNASSNTQLLQSDKDMSVNYFLDDNSILERVAPGELYMFSSAMESTGLEVGDKLTIVIEGLSREFTIAGGIKDAVLGSNMMGMVRYIINADDYDDFISDETISVLYGGRLYYINTSDMGKMLSEIADITDSFIFTMDHALLTFSYVFDMILTGLLLVISLILIAVAFVVLRFTIAFTLSEEFREIGVMKAIGISNFKIRGLYLVKYAALSVIGAVIGLALSFPFNEILMSVSSKSVIINNQNPVFVNILCVIFVIAVILLFCYSCTGKVNKLTPIDAIRNGQTGERFRKKSLMSLGRSKLSATPFLALNDIVSSPKRFGIITLTFFLCLSLMLMLSTTITTLCSDKLFKSFGFAECHISLDANDKITSFMIEGGRETLEVYLDDLEEKLAENGMPAECFQELAFNFKVSHGNETAKIMAYQGTGTTMDMYEYTAGTAPQSCDEIAITRIAANLIKADLGDTVTIKTVDGDKKYIITAFFQSMNTQGSTIRFFTDEEINYVQASGGISTQVRFTDDPDNAEIINRMDKIKELYPELDEVITCAEWTKRNVGVADALEAVKSLTAILSIVLAALVTVLMERSFIAKETGEIALMKAIGTRNGKICAYHALRFLFVGIIAVTVAEICAMPLTHLCIDPLFRMMGMELAADYIIDPLEMFLIFPAIILATTALSAFLTSLYTRKINASDTANIE
ncbi:MAG: FtsX-like permease family protein [Oscillospiraceae bacterium]|nr:FtsX-like permease family protein [Oscillospiraceae bacterium]